MHIVLRTCGKLCRKTAEIFPCVSVVRPRVPPPFPPSPSLLQVKDLPALAQKQLAPAEVQGRLTSFMKEYKAQHIDKGSFAPLVHTMVGVFCLSYCVTWPSEYRHMQHQKEHKK